MECEGKKRNFNSQCCYFDQNTTFKHIDVGARARSTTKSICIRYKCSKRKLHESELHEWYGAFFRVIRRWEWFIDKQTTYFYFYFISFFFLHFFFIMIIIIHIFMLRLFVVLIVLHMCMCFLFFLFISSLLHSIRHLESTNAIETFSNI